MRKSGGCAWYESEESGVGRYASAEGRRQQTCQPIRKSGKNELPRRSDMERASVRFLVLDDLHGRPFTPVDGVLTSILDLAQRRKCNEWWVSGRMDWCICVAPVGLSEDALPVLHRKE